MPLPETPRRLLRVFSSPALIGPNHPRRSGPSESKLLNYGLTITEQPNTGLDTLITFVRILMPYRYAGSGFYDLWTRVIRYSHDLPVPSQIAL